MSALKHGILGTMIATLLLIPIFLSAPFPIIIVSIFILYVLTYLTLIDFQMFRLPNHATLPLMAAGLLWHLVIARTTTPFDYIYGAIIGYAVIWALRAYYLKRRNIEAIGLGDAKFLAAAGAWLGWQGLPFVLLTASVSALLIVTIQSFFGKKLDSRTAIPFGPYLCIGFWTVWSSKYVVF
jgi:prepilin signal peptidase PulO-like enzyme (type II secretory pathway)